MPHDARFIKIKNTLYVCMFYLLDNIMWVPVTKLRDYDTNKFLEILYLFLFPKEVVASILIHEDDPFLPETNDNTTHRANF